MKRTRYLYAGVAIVTLGAAFGLSLEAKQSNQALVPPTFAVDATWPKPLPNGWISGEIGGTCVDSQDHIFVVTRGFQNGGLTSPEGVGGADPATGALDGVFKSKAAPPVIEYDQDGNVVNAWGDPSLVPANNDKADKILTTQHANCGAPQRIPLATCQSVRARRNWNVAGDGIRVSLTNMCRAPCVKRSVRTPLVYRCSSDFVRRCAQEFHEID